MGTGQIDIKGFFGVHPCKPPNYWVGDGDRAFEIFGDTLGAWGENPQKIDKFQRRAGGGISGIFTPLVNTTAKGV